MHMIFCVDVRNGECGVATVLPVRGVGLAASGRVFESPGSMVVGVCSWHSLMTQLAWGGCSVHSPAPNTGTVSVSTLLHSRGSAMNTLTWRLYSCALLDTVVAMVAHVGVCIVNSRKNSYNYDCVY